MLRFWGRGSAFTPDNTSACFMDGGDLILIDLPMSSLQKMIQAGPKAIRTECKGGWIERIYVLITHTHSDHIGGIPMLIHYAYYVWGKIPVTVIAPSPEVAEDMHFYIDRLEGCDDDAYTIITADAFHRNVKAVIPTTHAEKLAGRCFGYCLDIGGKNVVYTGDTNTLEPFMPYLTEGTYLYTEISAFPSPVHLSADEAMDTLKELSSKGIKVYLMHLDDEAAIKEKFEGTGIQKAPLFSTTLISLKRGREYVMDHEKVLSEIFTMSQQLYNDMSSTANTDHTKVFNYLTELGRILTQSDRASFWKWDRASHTLWTTAATGAERITIPDTTGLVGKALSMGKVIVTNDPYNDPNFNKDVDKKTGYVTKSILTMPVANIEGEYIGAYQVINKLGGDGKYDAEDDCRKLSLAAMICGLALESDVFLEESHTDRLTHLRNRMGFFHDFDKKYNLLLEDPEGVLSLFICDIDKFKHVNDTYGHNTGDAVLEQVASILNQNCVPGGNVYRWGGEEFIMLMPGHTMEQAGEKAEQLRLLIEANDCVTEEYTVHHTMSFGVTQFDREKTINENVSVADEKLYTAKETGRNRVVV